MAHATSLSVALLGRLQVCRSLPSRTAFRIHFVRELYTESNSQFSGGQPREAQQAVQDILPFSAQGLNNFDFFGSSISVLPDLDQDGIPELIVGATGDRTDGRNTFVDNDGAAHVLSLEAGGRLNSSWRLADGQSPLDLRLLNSQSRFGSAVAWVSAAGPPSDRVHLVAVGASTDGDGAGAVHLIRFRVMPPPPPSPPSPPFAPYD
eukprot:4003844-Pleurochrysis_carterae.AAC.1